MHPYVLILLIASLVSAVHAGWVVAQDAPRRASLFAALMIGCGAFWAFCQVAWNLSDSAEGALFFVRLSALGWLPIPPLAVRLILSLTQEPLPRVRSSLPLLYGGTALAIALDCFTPWLHPEVSPTSWGWTYRTGPGYPLVLAFVTLTAGGAIALGVQVLRGELSPAERGQLRPILLALCVPIVLGIGSDGLLPTLGIAVPQLGSIATALVGFASAWAFRRFGYSVLGPTGFANEILTALPVGVALLRPDGHIRSANEGLATLVGRPVDSLIDRHASEILASSDAGDPSRFEDGPYELCKASGERLPVGVSTRALSDRQGLLIGVVMVVRDQRELASLRTRLAISGRLAAVGELAAGMAHEINNPLTYVRANLRLLQEHWRELRTDLDPVAARERVEMLAEGTELIEESLEGVDRATAIVREVKGFSHAGGGEREAADLNALLDSALRVASAQLGNAIAIERAYAELPPLRCDAQELKQVFLNLLLNAGQAIEDSGRIRITTRTEGKALVACFEDDGCGMEPAVLERIFDPFFTTKSVGEGTGLGLSISYEIVRRHSGEIRVESVPGRGTRFEVCLPA